MGDHANQIPRPAEGVRELERYHVPRSETPVDVHLDGNLGPRAPESFVDRLDLPSPDRLRAYPNADDLIAAFASRFDVPEERILPTAGSNGALLRASTAYLDGSRSMVAPVPTFSLFPRFAAAVGAEHRPVEWRGGDYPADAILRAADDDTGLIVAVSPNNPTGLPASREALERVAGATSALLLVDHAYAEYADQDLTDLAVRRDDIVVTRTLSKAWGLAGIRIGCAVGAPEVLENLEVVGNTYGISIASMELAVRWMENRGAEIRGHVDRVRSHRNRLQDRLREFGAEPTESTANFVYAHFDDPRWVRDALAGMGFGVRAFDEDDDRADALRITVPGEPEVFETLEHAVGTVFAPEGFWIDLETVVAEIERPDNPSEASKARLADLRAAVDGWRVGLVSRRAPEATEQVLEALELNDVVDEIAAAAGGDGDDESQLERLAGSLGVDRAWMATSEASWVRAARAASVLPVGVTSERVESSECDGSLVASGAARTMSGWEEVGAYLEGVVDR